MPKRKPAPAPKLANAELVEYLKRFYSIGQLQLYYDTLIDGKPLPNMGEDERRLRVQAIAQILGKTPPKQYG